jgi:hypothetical protein
MKGLCDLSVLLTAPALEELQLSSMGHLDPGQVMQLASLPTLRKATLGLGSNWKNTAAALPLPPIDTASLYLNLKASSDQA